MSVSENATMYARKRKLIGEDAVISVEDIMNGRVPEEMKGMLKSYQSKIENARAEIYLQKERLREAEDGSGALKYTTGLVDKDYGAFTGQDVLDAAITITGNKDLTILDAMDIIINSQIQICKLFLIFQENLIMKLQFTITIWKLLLQNSIYSLVNFIKCLQIQLVV